MDKYSLVLEVKYNTSMNTTCKSNNNVVRNRKPHNDRRTKCYAKKYQVPDLPEQGTEKFHQPDTWVLQAHLQQRACHAQRGLQKRREGWLRPDFRDADGVEKKSSSSRKKILQLSIQKNIIFFFFFLSAFKSMLEIPQRSCR